jgi:NhaA family Na+:H+ antiporter
MMSVEVRRKVKAVLVMAMLAGAEVRHAQQEVRFNTGPTSAAVTAGAKHLNEEMDALMTSPELTGQTKSIAEQMDVMMASVDFQKHAKRIADKMEAMVSSSASVELGERTAAQVEGLNEQERFAAQIQAIMADPKFQEEAHNVAEQMGAMLADTTLQKQAKTVAEQVKAVQAEPEFKVKAKHIAEEMETLDEEMSAPKEEAKIEIEPELQAGADRIGERVEKLMADPKLQDRSETFAEELHAVKSDPNIQEKAGSLAEQMDAITTDPNYMEQAKRVGPFLEAMMTNPNSPEHAKRFEEQMEVMMRDPKLQEQKKLLSKQIAAMMDDSNFQEHMKLAGEQMAAMKGDSSFKGKAKQFAEEVDEMMADPTLQKEMVNVGEQFGLKVPDQESFARAPAGRRLAGTPSSDEEVDELVDNIMDKLFGRSQDSPVEPLHADLEQTTLGKQGTPTSSRSTLNLAAVPVPARARGLTGLTSRLAGPTYRPGSALTRNLQPPSASSRMGPAIMSSMGDGDDSPKGTFTKEELDYFEKRPALPDSNRIKYLAAGWGSVGLVVGTIFSLAVANSQFSEGYVHFWEQAVGYGPAAWHLMMPLKDWVNEAVMAFFFFLVGMEIKREVLFGSLADIKKAALPCIAALGGMVVPAGIYCAVCAATGSPFTGWAIPMATDIAFAMGVYNLFAAKLPKAMAAFLLTLATVDDLGAIAVIAVFFAKHINAMWLAGAAGATLLLEGFRRKQVRASQAYLAAGIALWYCLLRGGVNADVAGVLAGFAIPAIGAPKYTKAPEKYPNLLDHYIHYWTGWANFVIMPLFAIANTAVVLSGSAAAVVSAPVAQGIMAGLLLGKPLGIAGASLAALKVGICSWPTGLKPIHLGIAGMLGGIAFTMSLFLIEQSLTGGMVMNAKLAVIAGSTLAAFIAAAGASGQTPPAPAPLPPPPPPAAQPAF